MPQSAFDLSLGLEGTHVLVTGGKGLIGRVVVEAFLAAEAKVSIIDLPGPSTFKKDFTNLKIIDGDITKDIDASFAAAEATFGTVECCIALASIDLSSLPQTESICDMDPQIWQKVFHVNINGTFLTCQRWLRGIRSASENPQTLSLLKNVGLIIMGSEAGKFGVRTMAAYAAGKSAVQYGLVSSLAVDAPRIYGRARVNAIAPGAVDTERLHEEFERYGEQFRWKECEATVGLAKPVSLENVARTIVVLASERYSGSTHGQVLHVDGGKTGIVVWPKEDLANRTV